MNLSQHILLNEEAAAAMSVAGGGKFKSACDRKVAASRYVLIAPQPSSQQESMAAMLRTPSLSSADCHDHNWSEDEFTRLEAYVNGLPAHESPGIGHNDPPSTSFDDAVKENLRRGIYLSQLKTIIQAIRDPRLSACELQVLAQIIERTNSKSGMAYPGRARLAADITYYNNKCEPQRYSEPSIATAVSKLIRYGYLISDKRAPEIGGRALSHYGTAIPSVEELEAQIAAWCQKIRQQPRREFPAAKSSSDVDTGINLRNSVDDDTSINVSPSEVAPEICTGR